MLLDTSSISSFLVLLSEHWHYRHSYVPFLLRQLLGPHYCVNACSCQASVWDVPLERLFYMTFQFSLLEKQNGKDEVPLFPRVDLMYYSLLSILARDSY